MVQSKDNPTLYLCLANITLVGASTIHVDDVAPVGVPDLVPFIIKAISLHVERLYLPMRNTFIFFT